MDLSQKKLGRGHRLGMYWRWGVATVLALVLSACQTPQTSGSLTNQQKQALLSQGFALEDSGWELQMSGKLLFEFDSAVVREAARTQITQLAQALIKEHIERLRVEGYTDDRGSDAYNLKLSLRRAQSVKDVLVEAGMLKQNIEVIGLGNALPVVKGNAAENRRVAIVVPLL